MRNTSTPKGHIITVLKEHGGHSYRVNDTSQYAWLICAGWTAGTRLEAKREALAHLDECIAKNNLP